jgi:hypothetical protein
MIFGSRITRSRSRIMTAPRKQKRYFETENADNECTVFPDSELQNPSDQK